MSKTFRYVKEFDFSSAGKPVGYCMGGRVKKAEGGVVTAAMPKADKVSATKQYAMEKANIAKERTPKIGSGMVVKSETLGVRGNKNPGIKRASVPVAPRQPMIAPYAKGGAVPKAGAYKIPKVMSEYKSGELHSGSKTGPVVKSRKQAVAIALSETRAAGKKK